MIEQYFQNTQNNFQITNKYLSTVNVSLHYLLVGMIGTGSWRLACSFCCTREGRHRPSNTKTDLTNQYFPIIQKQRQNFTTRRQFYLLYFKNITDISWFSAITENFYKWQANNISQSNSILFQYNKFFRRSMEVKLSALLGNHDRLTEQPTDRRRT